MHIVKVGEDTKFRVVDNEDLKAVNNLLIDLNCPHKVSHKEIEDFENRGASDGNDAEAKEP